MTFCQCAGKPAIGVAAMEQSVASPRLAAENAETSLRHTDHFRLSSDRVEIVRA